MNKSRPEIDEMNVNNNNNNTFGIDFMFFDFSSMLYYDSTFKCILLRI